MPRSKTSPELYKTNPFEDASRQNSVINRERRRRRIERSKKEEIAVERGEKFGNDRWKERHFSPLCDSIFFAVPDREWRREGEGE